MCTYDKCWYCDGFYGVNYGEPICSTCHVFLFPDLVEDLDSKLICDEKLESNDSGNEDSDQEQQLNQQNDNNNNLEALNTFLNKINQNKIIDTSKQHQQSLHRDQALHDRLMSLSCLKDNNDLSVNEGVLDALPNELLLKIFRNLDDLSLWVVSNVCKRWLVLIENEFEDSTWKEFVCKRWYLFKTNVKVSNWRRMYNQLVQSSNCFYCLKNMIGNNQSNVIDSSPSENEKTWRHKRLLLELKALQQDPPEGINAKPIDNSCYYWQASITGPHGSPYEGGIFYLFIQIPQSYPLRPPLVRFITRIYHPNISRHGDIGLDSIHDNWSLALTISKILISIQSLLTDPYTHVCMENTIGNEYVCNRTLFEYKAKLYTWKYAMNDYILLNNNENKFLSQLCLKN